MWHTLKKEEVLKNLNTNEKEGLSEQEVKNRQERDGKNKLEEKKKESIFIKFIKQFNDFMIIILIIASIISAIVSKIQGESDYIDSIIIIGIVIFNSLMGVIQEVKAEKSIEALKKMTPQMAKVIRNGKTIEIPAEELVKGDIIVLEAGNYVPADARILESYNLKIEESSLTGETEPSLKEANQTYNNEIPLGDRKNMAFMASITVNGHGKAVVTDIGMNTNVGKIANMMMENETPETPLQRKLGEVGKILGIACLVICIIIFVMGLIKHIEPVEMFMTSVGLAVAAIPEGLPAIVTIMLSIGVTKMAKKHSIIRKLPAVETLGSSNVICSDKTGTLTQNKMKVVEVKSKETKFAIELASLCTDCDIFVENGENIVTGEATEKAIVEEGLLIGESKQKLEKIAPRINEIPFDSNRKMMTTIHKIGNKYRIITKGAPDVLLARCTKEILNIMGDIDVSNNQIRVQGLNENRIKSENQNMAQNALRVIAVAYKDIDVLPSKIDSNTIENNLTFIGLIGMIDPPREGVKEAVKTCKRAGIKTVMITGDHLETAKAIAKDLGILDKKDKAITGQELDRITQKQLEQNIKDYAVFARVTPEHKVRIVRAWQKNGAVVAMTGDGVNDSPALKNADIGIAMGKNGTDVAKNAADIILTNDNFVTIVEAVKQGRNIYDNVKKAIHFLIATNIGEIVTIFMGLILGMKSPLLAIQLLWINLVTDSLPAIALGLEKPEKDIMKRKPINSKKGIFADGLWNKIITEGTMIGMLTLVAFSIGNKYFGLEVGRTMAFLAIGFLELVHSVNVKNEKSIFDTGIFENKYLVGSFILGIFVQSIVVIVPFLANIFELVPLNRVQWIITIVISILPIPIIELQKKMNETKLEKIGFQNDLQLANIEKK